VGQPERALEWAFRALTIAPDDPITLYNVACAFALLGEAERAIDILQRWHDGVKVKTSDWFRTDTDFDGIRENPRFKALFPTG
jgi:adenylate cyclase